MSYVFAILSALLTIAAFEPLGYHWLAWIALIPLLVAIQIAKRPFVTGFLWGVVFFTASLHWIPHIFNTYALSNHLFGVPAMLLLSAYLAIFPAIFAWGIRQIVTSNHHSLWTAVQVASLFVALEFLRGTLFTGFPWNLLGYSVLNFDYISQVLRVVGVYGLGFIVVFINYTLYVLLVKSFRPNMTYLFLGCGALLGVTVFYSAWVIGVEETFEYDSIPVRVVQGNIDQFQKWDDEYAEANLERHISLSRHEDFSSGLLVWPESALPFFFNSDHPGKQRVTRLVRELQSTLITGALFYESKEDGTMSYYNSAAVLDAEGQLVDRYDKIHLVPFGEYTPFKETLLPFVEKFVMGEDYSSGTQWRALQTPHGRAGTFICFESIFPELVARVTREADFLVNITNDAWFGETWAPYQHLAMARARAIENGKYLIRNSNSGITAVYDQFGRVVEHIPLQSSGAFSVDVDIIPRITLFNRYPYLFPVFALLVTVFGAMDSWRGRRRKKVSL